MDKLTKLVRLGWSPWYVRAAWTTALLGVALISACSLLSRMDFETDGRVPFSFVGMFHTWKSDVVHGSQTIDQQVSESQELRRAYLDNEQLRKNFRILCDLYGWAVFMSGFPFFVIYPSLIVGYGGFSLDAGYKWLKRQEHPSQR